MSLDQQRLDRVTEIMKVLAHSTRMQITLFLSQQGPSNVSTIQTQLQLEQSLLSHHLIKMKDRGILYSDRKGKEIVYALIDPTLVEVITLILKPKLAIQV